MTKEAKFCLTDQQLEIVITTVQRKLATLVRDTIEEVVGIDRQRATDTTTAAKIIASLANGPLTKTDLRLQVGTGNNGFTRILAKLIADKQVIESAADGPHGRLVRVISLATTQPIPQPTTPD